ncbi:MAG: signal recognition particle receptor subunit alpha, partial [Acidobacteria bacterium]|nr:signal recognition particle receptor subunit alpha [Acidobacteriota bacterium]
MGVGFFDRLRDGLSRTKQQIVDRFDEIVRRADDEVQHAKPIDVDTVEALEELLISADVGVAATERIVTAVRERARRGESLRELVKREIRSIFETVDQTPSRAVREGGPPGQRSPAGSPPRTPARWGA